MPRPNTSFELSVEDLDLIEDALRTRKSSLCDQLAGTKGKDAALKQDVSGIHDLLGRLHNQKEFFRPKGAPYVSG